MNIYGTNISKNDLNKAGNIRQLFGTRHYTLSRGAAKGTRCIDVSCGEFSFTVVPDRGMDISQAALKGCNLVYQTPVGEASPAFYNSGGAEFIKTFFAGMLTTCGLANISGPCVDEGEAVGLHGRFSNTPVDNFCDLSRWEGDDYIIELTGVVQEAFLATRKLRLRRVIRTVAGERRLTISDEVENFGLTASPLVLLYHVNPGYPLLDDGAEIAVSDSVSEGYNSHSNNHIEGMLRVGPPEAGYPEQNFLHTMKSENCRAMLINRKLMGGGVALYVKWSRSELPYMSLWKNLDGTDYVVGLEPCLCPCMPRDELRRMGLVPVIEPGEIRKFRVEIGVLEGAEIPT
ncbi:MAG: aldose 1-epimerase family protein [Oscillospiraceae bacterium]|nr:aldose 1-epimerase family protein [Oscillospiraceae bacterium]